MARPLVAKSQSQTGRSEERLLECMNPGELVVRRSPSVETSAFRTAQDCASESRKWSGRRKSSLQPGLGRRGTRRHGGAVSWCCLSYVQRIGTGHPLGLPGTPTAGTSVSPQVRHEQHFGPEAMVSSGQGAASLEQAS